MSAQKVIKTDDLCTFTGSGLPFPRNEALVQVLILGGGLASSKQLKTWVRDAQKEQHSLCQGTYEDKLGKSKRPRVGVDRVFLRRLLKILKM